MNRRLLLGLLSLLPALPAAALAAADSPRVAGVELSGRSNVRESTCLEALSLKPGQPFSPEKLEADRKALLALGYFRSVLASQTTRDGMTQVTFKLVEWPVIRHIRVVGNTVVDGPAIREAVSTQLGQVLCGPQLQNDIRAIERLYRERGYVARISERLLDDATQSGILRFEILELRIAEVAFEGATEKLRDRARATVVEQAPNFYRPEDVTLDQRRLLRLSGIQNAVPKVSLIAPGQVRIVWLLNPPADTPEKMEPEGPR